MAVYGYARASTTGQTLATQKAMLLAGDADIQRKGIWRRRKVA